MKGGKIYLGRMVFAVAVLLATACTKEKLDKREPQGYVEITLNWDGSEKENDGGRIYFYSTEGDKPLVLEKDCEYSDAVMKHIFRGTLPTGSYHVITMNRQHTNAELLHAENLETARIQVTDASNSTALTKADGSLIGEPATVYLTHELDDDRFPDHILVVNNRDTLKTQTTPKLMVRRVSFTITLDEFSADKCTAIFNGVSHSVKCATSSALPNAVARVKFALDPSDDDPKHIFTGKLNVFGLIPTGSETHQLELTFTVDGEEASPKSVDITDVVAKKLQELADKDEDYSYDIPLDLVIGLTRSIDGDLHASVDDWDDGGSGSGSGGYDTLD